MKQVSEPLDLMPDLFHEDWALENECVTFIKDVDVELCIALKSLFETHHTQGVKKLSELLLQAVSQP